jgi:serine/threonine protein kinase
MMENYVGQQLGNYRLIRLLGKGGFAEVYLGEHIHLRTRAAIKVLQMRLAENNAEAFIQEARMVAHLIHPHIIRVLDFGVREAVPFLVMDYAPGGTLRQRYLRGMPLPATTLFPHITQIATALQYAHNNKLVHRDVKPENMLIGANNEVLLTDFGLALTAYNTPSAKKDMSGTVTYMAPEQVQGRARPGSDQYSLAVVVYEWLTGTLPFLGSMKEIATQQVLAPPPSLRDKTPNISYEVERVVFKALAKNPLQRFATIMDFAEALQEASQKDTRQTSAIMWAQQKPHVPLDHPTFPQNGLTGSIRKLDPPPGPVPFPKTPLTQSHRIPDMQANTMPTNTAHLAAAQHSQVFASQRIQPTGHVNAVQNSFAQQNTTRNKSTISSLYAGPMTPEQLYTSKYLQVVPQQTLPTTFPAQNSHLHLPAEQMHQDKSSTKIAAVNIQGIASSKSLEKKPGFSAKTWMLVSLLLIILIIGSASAGLFHYLTVGQQGKPPIINLGPKSAPTIANSITPTPSSVYPPTSPPQLDDPLLINQLDWDEGSNCNFVAGVYRIALPTGGSTTCYARSTNYHNFIYQVQMTFVKMGQQFSAGGITFRGDENINTSYNIEIFENGQFSFVAHTGKTTTKVIAGYPQNTQGIAGFHTQPGQSNTLAIVAHNHQFTFFVNNQPVFGPIQDTTSDHGMLGVFATGGLGSDRTEITFSDVKVWQL